jgi:hypothetical protein
MKARNEDEFGKLAKIINKRAPLLREIKSKRKKLKNRNEGKKKKKKRRKKTKKLKRK